MNGCRISIHCFVWEWIRNGGLRGTGCLTLIHKLGLFVFTIRTFSDAKNQSILYAETIECYSRIHINTRQEAIKSEERSYSLQCSKTEDDVDIAFVFLWFDSMDFKPRRINAAIQLSIIICNRSTRGKKALFKNEIRLLKTHFKKEAEKNTYQIE